MSITINGTTVTAVNVDSRTTGLVLAGDSAVFSNFENGVDAETNTMSTSSTMLDPGTTVFANYNNVYDFNISLSNFVYNEETENQSFSVWAKLYPYSNNNKYYQIYYNWAIGKEVKDKHTINISEVSNGTVVNRLSYSYEYEYQEQVGFSGAKFGIRILNTSFKPQAYYRKPNAQSDTTTSMFSGDGLTEANSYKNGRPRLESYAVKSSGFKDNCTATFTIKQYQTVNNT